LSSDESGAFKLFGSKTTISSGVSTACSITESSELSSGISASASDSVASDQNTGEVKS